MDQSNHLSRWRAAAAVISLLVAVATAAAFAFYDQFSSFAWTDDEGFAIMTVRHVLDGHRLYDDVMVFYGPAYNLAKWVLHGPVLGVPITHDNVRFIGIVWLILSSLTIAFAARRERQEALAVSFLVVFLFLRDAFRREPGHPQELIAVAVCLMPLASSWIASRPLRAAAALGLLAAFAGLCKINVGVFSVVGIGVGLCFVGMRFDGSKAGQATRLLAVLVAVAASAFVFALTFRHLGEAWVTALVVIVQLTIAVVGVVSWCELRDHSNSNQPAIPPLPRSIASFALAGLLLTALITGFFLARGTTLAAMKEALVDVAARVPDAVEFRLHNSPLKLSLGLVPSLLLATAYLFWRRGGKPSGHFETVLGLGKLASGVLFVAAGALGRHTSGLILLPLIWLALVSDSDETSDDPVEADARRRRRILVAFIAALQPLQMFPVAGSQRNIGGVLSVYLGLLVFYDAIAWLRRRPRLALNRAWIPRAVSALALLASLALLAMNTLGAASRYYSREPLALPGARLMRLPDGQVAALHFLSNLARTRETTLVTVPGLNSLYMWTGTPPPTLDVVTVAAHMLTEKQQQNIGDAAAQADRPLVLLQRARQGERFTGMVSDRATPLEERLRREFELAGVLVCPETGWDLELRVRRESPPLEWIDCVRWELADASGQMTWPFAFRSAPADAVRAAILDPKDARVLADTQKRPAAAQAQLLDDEGRPSDKVPKYGALRVTPLEPIAAIQPWIVRFYDDVGERRRTLPIVASPEVVKRID